ncbi:MAG: amidase [Pyrinomonadaceae bacterium]|nr:amidase [Pyrinomonadaceae bacterium]
MNNLHEQSAIEILKLIESKQVSSREVVQHFINRIEEVNPKLNAVVIKLYDEALKKADEADENLAKGNKLGKLHGLPFTIKECLDYVGTPSTLGVLARKNDVAKTNDLYVEALQNQGGIVLGKTNVPQLMVFIECTNNVYGTTNNPQNVRFAPGGSSGGEGAIVGAKASPFGIGTDLGGSVRFPAAFCGACSIKPTMWRTFDQTRFGGEPFVAIFPVTGAIANHAEDLPLVLEIMNDAVGNRWKTEPLQDYKKIDVTKLKVGYFTSDGLLEPMNAIKRGVLESVEKLKFVGCEVVEFQPPKFQFCEEIFYRIVTVNGVENFYKLLDGEKPVKQLKDLMMMASASAWKRNAVISLAKTFGQKNTARLLSYFGGSGEEFLRTWTIERENYQKLLESEMDKAGIDAILSPMAALPAFLQNSVDKVGLGGNYSILYNVSGLPAGVAQVGKVQQNEAVARKAGFDVVERKVAQTEALSAGLPLSVQIGAKPWREDIIFSLLKVLHKTI